jgi:urease accessory protein
MKRADATLARPLMTPVLRAADPLLGRLRPASGSAKLRFSRSGKRTVLAEALAVSPLRLLAPRNHGDGAWVFLSNLGGGLVDGDRLDVRVEVEESATALLGTQASTKVYRSPHGCSQRLEAHIGEGAALAMVPDPVVCFAGARYAQEIRIDLAPNASLFLVDGYTCGRAARNERWDFERYASRTAITRDSAQMLVDATTLDPSLGSIADRMGRFNIVMSVVAIGPRFADVRRVLLAALPAPSSGSSVITAASPLGRDGALLRVAADRFEKASQALRPSFDELTRSLGDNPFVRKW